MSSTTWAQALPAWHNHHRYVRRVADITARDFLRTIGRHGAWMGARGVEELGGVTPALCEAWMAEQLGRLATSTARTRLKRVRAFWRWATEAGHVETDPTRTLRIKRDPSEAYASLGSRPVVDEDMIRAMTLDPAHRTHRAIMVLWATGMRPGELRRLTAEDVLDGVVVVRKSKRKTRRLPIDERLRGMLLSLVGQVPSAESLTEALHCACRRAGVEPFNAYWLRHSRASLWVDRDRHPLLQVAEWLGNSPRTLEKHYLHATQRGRGATLGDL